MSLRAAALFTCLAVGVSCSSAQRPAASSAATPQSSTLDLTLPELNGAPVQLKKRRGKVLVLVFFASWARGARVVLPQLEALAKTLDNPEIEFYGIAILVSAATSL